MTLWTKNGLKTLLPINHLGQIFLHPFGQKSMSQKKNSGGGQVGPRPRAKKTGICQAISAISQDISLKIETYA